jgi:hypothetical protein
VAELLEVVAVAGADVALERFDTDAPPQPAAAAATAIAAQEPARVR